MKLVIESVSENESFARTVVAAYITRLDPTLEELADVKTAVSEAVTNSIIHGYLGKSGEIEITCEIDGREVIIEVVDFGVGIPDIERPWNRFIRRNQSGSALEWGLRLWRHLWMYWKCSLSRERARAYLCEKRLERSRTSKGLLRNNF